MNANVQPHVFLSYTRRDAEIMHRVRDTLRDEGLNVWVDEGIEPGTPLWDRAVEDGLKTAACMLVILTPNVMDSKGVRDEIHFAGMHQVHIFTVLAQGGPSESIPYTLSGNQFVDIRTNYVTNMVRLILAVQKHMGIVPHSQETAKLDVTSNEAVDLSAVAKEMREPVAVPKRSRMWFIGKWSKYLLAIGLEVFGGAFLGLLCGYIADTRYFAISNNDGYVYDAAQRYSIYTAIVVIVSALIFPIIRDLLLRSKLKWIWIYAFVVLPAIAVAVISYTHYQLESVLFVIVALLFALYILPIIFSNFTALFRGLRRLFVRG